jgi:hypothetical protein
MKIKWMEVYKEAADRLNERGVKPFSARQFSLPLVQQVMYGKVKNEDVVEEVRKVKLEWESNGTR